MRSTCKESYSGPRPFSEEESKVQIRAVDCPVVSCLMVEIPGSPEGDLGGF